MGRSLAIAMTDEAIGLPTYQGGEGWSHEEPPGRALWSQRTPPPPAGRCAAVMQGNLRNLPQIPCCAGALSDTGAPIFPVPQKLQES